MAPKLESDIDRLYQLPLEEFTGARNALAKTAGGDAARIRALTKPAVPAWGVNQLYWQDRATWDELIAASDEARRAHRAVLAGKSGDVRAAGKVHEDAVEKALKRTLALIEQGGHPATDATRQAVATTLRSLPGEEAPGRLTKPLQPGGFEALSGLSIAAASKIARMPKPAPAQAPRAAKPADDKPKIDPKIVARAKQAVATAERELREAQTAAQRAEFEHAKAEREEKRAAKEAEDARKAVDAARHRLTRTEEGVEAARERLESAKAELTKLS